jgi:hypothetical protein
MIYYLIVVRGPLGDDVRMRIERLAFWQFPPSIQWMFLIDTQRRACSLLDCEPHEIGWEVSPIDV